LTRRVGRPAALVLASLAALAAVLAAPVLPGTLGGGRPAAHAAGAPSAAALPADRPTGGKGAKTSPKADKPDTDVFLLPANFRNADGSFNQDAIVAQQKKRLEVINARLKCKLRLAETPHYLVFSDADPATTNLFVKWCEALYGSLRSQFGIGPKERIWDGKCILLLFASRAKFLDFAKEFDENNAADAGAFFAWEHYAPGLPECVHIAIPLDERDPRRLQELFAHEGTHAFFQLYRKAVDLPLWLHEGLAEYMTVVNDPTLKNLKMNPAMLTAHSTASLKRLLRSTTGTDLSLRDYAVAYSLVEFLVQAGRTNFKQLIVALKDGQSQDDALKAAYGFDAAGLEQHWRTWMIGGAGGTGAAGPKRR
jgi:hypothetical protein